MYWEAEGGILRVAETDSNLQQLLTSLQQITVRARLTTGRSLLATIHKKQHHSNRCLFKLAFSVLWLNKFLIAVEILIKLIETIWELAVLHHRRACFQAYRWWPWSLRYLTHRSWLRCILPMWQVTKLTTIPTWIEKIVLSTPRCFTYLHRSHRSILAAGYA